MALLLSGQQAAAGQKANLDDIGHDLGESEAPVLVVEYGDFACGACAQFAHSAWDSVRAEFVDTGRVRWKMVPIELGFWNSEEGARAAECAAGEGRFWEMHDALFEHRDRWVDERNPKDALVDLAAEVGLPRERFRDCYEDEWFEERTDAANEAAKEDGVRGTPTFFINGFRLVGAFPYDQFRSFLSDTTARPGRPALRHHR